MPIANTHGQQKQDCEINAAKRFLAKLKQDHPRLGLIITGDGLFSKAPMINHLLAQEMHYLLVAKPKDPTYMMDWLAAYPRLPLVASPWWKAATLKPVTTHSATRIKCR